MSIPSQISNAVSSICTSFKDFAVEVPSIVRVVTYATIEVFHDMRLLDRCIAAGSATAVFVAIKKEYIDVPEITSFFCLLIAYQASICC